MKRSIIYTFLLFVFFGCRDIRIGYLDYDNAGYNPSEMTIRILDPSNKEDQDRITREVHWVSNPIEGIEGTQPVLYSLSSVTDASLKDVTSDFSTLDVRGGGVLDVDYDHNLSPGVYKISIKVYNEGYDTILKDIFTIIVE